MEREERYTLHDRCRRHSRNIAQRFGTSVQELVEANDIDNLDRRPDTGRARLRLHHLTAKLRVRRLRADWAYQAIDMDVIVFFFLGVVLLIVSATLALDGGWRPERVGQRRFDGRNRCLRSPLWNPDRQAPTEGPGSGRPPDVPQGRVSGLSSSTVPSRPSLHTPPHRR